MLRPWSDAVEKLRDEALWHIRHAATATEHHTPLCRSLAAFPYDFGDISRWPMAL